MKTIARLSKFVVLGALIVISGTTSAETVKFTENTEAFSNPAQGWFHHSPDGLPKQQRVPYGGGYLRVDWALLEPEEGEYNWEVIEKAKRAYAKSGLPIYFRVMCANAHSKGEYCTPEWVFKKGAKSKTYDSGVRYPNQPKDMMRITPYFDDPVLLKEHAKFMKAFAAKYDGDPAIGAIDIGSFGTWGEWHVGHLGIPNPPFEIRKKYADMYLKNFKKTILVFMSDDAETLQYAIGTARKSRVGMRRDGVGSPWHYTQWIGTGKYVPVERMGDVWKDKPIIFEWFADYKAMVKNNWGVEQAAEWMLENHACLLNDNIYVDTVPESEMPHLIKLAKFMGARLVPTDAEFSMKDGKLAITLNGRNIGASRIYLPFALQYDIVNASGKTVGSLRSSENPRKWFAGEFSAIDSFDIPPSMLKGKYSIRARIFDTRKTLKDFRFAAKELDDTGRLILGDVEIK